MLPRSISEDEFKKQTVQEYLQGEYGLDREQAEELANQEWSIRQDVENLAHVKKAKLKKKNDHAGFGKCGIVMHQNRIIKAGDQELRLSTTAYKALRKKAILTKEDVEWLLCGDDEFLQKHAKGLNFPNFVPRFRGFRTWAVYEWIDKFQIRRKSK